ncbi:MAG: peptidoglycan-binding domain-containing protein [Candidatus Manganitrophus sp.]|nr:peptidoglycan-binding domain-containing protein [Candidatus Manganitrophus sp.]
MKFKIIAVSVMAVLFLVSPVYAQGAVEQDKKEQGGAMQNGGAGHKSEAPVVAEVVIIEVQEKLNDQGYDVGAPSGKLDSCTQQALRDFQKEKGLPQTGQPDEKTRTALGIQEDDTGMGGQQGGPQPVIETAASTHSTGPNSERAHEQRRREG